MSNEDLKTLQIKHDPGSQTWLIDDDSDDPGVIIDADVLPDSLPAAALFRSAWEMQKALEEAERVMSAIWKLYALAQYPMEDLNGCLKSIRAALGMAKNTKEMI